MYFVRVLLVLCVLLAAAIAQPAADNCGPSMTPRDIRERFLNGCSDQNLPDETVTCERAWIAFRNAFQSKDPTTIEPSDYEAYFNEIPIAVGEDQTLFWSATFELAGLISRMSESGVNVVSSYNIPSARIIKGFGNCVCWCGTTEGGIDYESVCPSDWSDPPGPRRQFWIEFSRLFALKTGGIFFYLVNGERSGGAYNTMTTFAREELPNLNEQVRVTKGVILVAHRKGQGESCGKGTLTLLEQAIKNKSFSYTCYDIYGSLSTQEEQLTACASKIIEAEQQDKEPEPNECFKKQDSGTLGPSKPSTMPIFFLCILTLYNVMIIF